MIGSSPVPGGLSRRGTANVSDWAATVVAVLMAQSFVERNGSLLQIIAAVLIWILGGVVGYLVYRYRRSRKTFDYRVISDLPILSHRPDDEGLKVTYNGVDVANPRMFRIRFTNTGNKPIKQDDFLDEYVVTLENADLKSVSIVDQSVPNLAGFQIQDRDPATRKITLSSRTLNPRNTFTVQMIVDSVEDVEVDIFGRILDESRPSRVEITKQERSDIYANIVGFSLVSAIIGVPGVLILLADIEVARPTSVRELDRICGVSFGCSAVRGP